ncbi:uncharacterized protein LOC111629979 isoform X1 [Centruroides sculpturatus]|uniref:uncharacterized protein LOC111629978 isoform X1 n=2 Tax=Centruroides sculpturatus TaxID=218467 RepID=UPI000C6DF043|nr:uncharacterized protein LOC111629978 isoform X1 [Centruroides sculpturatus]XP_023229722.1 uncharacterized protein LOC111629979 isoform X1 [Centruroides sculpturatus]
MCIRVSSFLCFDNSEEATCYSAFIIGLYSVVMILDLVTSNNLALVEIYSEDTHYKWYFVTNIIEWFALLIFSFLLYVALELENYKLMMPWMVWIWVKMIRTILVTFISLIVVHSSHLFITVLQSILTLIFCTTGLYFFICVYNHYIILKARELLLIPERISTNSIDISKENSYLSYDIDVSHQVRDTKPNIPEDISGENHLSA